MRLFYRTVASFPERKRKPRQCPEKLRTIGKYKSSFLFFLCMFQRHFLSLSLSLSHTHIHI